MEMLVVQGGTPLHGRVVVSGSKNAALPIMAASLMTQGQTVLENVPDLVDVRTLGLLLTSLGVDVARDDQDRLLLEVQNESNSLADYELVRRMRASICVLGPLLAKRGEAVVSLPGGCHIGHRPVDLHLKGLTALGAEIEVKAGYLHATAKRLTGTDIDLSGPQGSTVTGTCNVMAAASLARGTTIIRSAACEPEVVALADFLNSAGAQISGQGTSELIIDGVRELHAVHDSIIPDRIEAATLMIAALISKGSIQLDGIEPDHMTEVIRVLRELGASITISALQSTLQHGTTRSLRSAFVSSPSMVESFLPIDVVASPYPGIPTDVQAQLMALLSMVPGVSSVQDQVFPDRFMHVSELCRLGAQIDQHLNQSTITGVDQLTGATVMASDLRASAALVLAGLGAQGITKIRRIYHLDRGYERLEVKLSHLGAKIARVQDDSDERTLPAISVGQKHFDPDSDSQRRSA